MTPTTKNKTGKCQRLSREMALTKIFADDDGEKADSDDLPPVDELMKHTEDASTCGEEINRDKSKKNPGEEEKTPTQSAK